MITTLMGGNMALWMVLQRLEAWLRTILFSLRVNRAPPMRRGAVTWKMIEVAT